MSDSLRESISVLVDDEAQELELHRVLGSMENNEELRQTWRRYQSASFLMKRQMDCRFDLDISGRVAAALADEPVVTSVIGVNEKTRFSRTFKPVLSMAVAASAAFIVIFAVQISEQNKSGEQIAAGEQPLITHLVAEMKTANENILTVGSEVMTPVERRLQSLIKNHTQQANMSQNRGVMPSGQLVEGREGRGY
jgi:sigma-E factor negative regulatory protein RseA